MTSKDKKKFRQTVAWKNYREQRRETDKVDALTLRPLSKTFQLHHLDLNDENYTLLSEDRQICLNQKSHETVHHLISYYKKDPEILDRLKEILDKMLKFSENT